MKGQIVEWNNGKGYKRGLLCPEKQIKSVTKMGRALVYLLDEDLNLQRNEKGGTIVGLATLSNMRTIGFQD